MANEGERGDKTEYAISYLGFDRLSFTISGQC